MAGQQQLDMGGGLVPERRPKGNGGATTVEGCWRGYSGRKTPQITILPVAGRANSAGNGSPSPRWILTAP